MDYGEPSSLKLRLIDVSQAAMLAIRPRDEGFHGIIDQILNIPLACHPELFPQGQHAY